MITKNMWLRNEGGSNSMSMGFLRDTLHPVLFHKNEKTGYADYTCFFQIEHYPSYYMFSCRNEDIIETEKDINMSVVGVDKTFEWKDAVDLVKKDERVVYEFSKLATFKKAISNISKLQHQYIYKTAMGGSKNRKMLRKHLTFAIMLNKLEDVCAIYNRTKVDGLGVSLYILNKEHTKLAGVPTVVYSSHMYVCNHETNVFKVDGVNLRNEAPFSIGDTLNSIDSVIHKGKASELKKPSLSGRRPSSNNFPGMSKAGYYSSNTGRIPSRSKESGMNITLIDDGIGTGSGIVVVAGDDGHKVAQISLPKAIYGQLGIDTRTLKDYFRGVMGLRKHSLSKTSKLIRYIDDQGIKPIIKILTRSQELELRSHRQLTPPSITNRKPYNPPEPPEPGYYSDEPVPVAPMPPGFSSKDMHVQVSQSTTRGYGKSYTNNWAIQGDGSTNIDMAKVEAVAQELHVKLPKINMDGVDMKSYVEKYGINDQPPKAVKVTSSDEDEFI